MPKPIHWTDLESVTETEIILKEIRYELRLIVILLEQLREGKERRI